MSRKFLLIGGLVLCAMFSFSTAAFAAPAPLSASYVTECGSATITFVNTTRFSFAFDYRVGDQAPTYTVYPGLEGVNISQGPYAGQPFGPYYTFANVPANGSIDRTITLAEDQGGGSVEIMYKLQIGAEQNWYLLPVTFTVETDCLPPEITPEPLPETAIDSGLPSAAFVCLTTTDEPIPGPHYVQWWNGVSWSAWNAWVDQTWKGANYEISIHTNDAEFIFGDVYRIVGDNGNAVRYFELLQPGVCAETGDPTASA